jgi:hypothetical protein
MHPAKAVASGRVAADVVGAAGAAAVAATITDRAGQAPTAQVQRAAIRDSSRTSRGAKHRRNVVPIQFTRMP